MVTILLLLLIFVMYVMVAGNAPQAVNGWNVTIGGQAPYLYAGDNGTLYVFSGNNVSMIGADGAVKWRVGVPENWTITNEWSQPTAYNDLNGISWTDFGRNGGFRPDYAPAVAAENGILYMYVRPNLLVDANSQNTTYGVERALGPDWKKQPVYARLMAISQDGTVLWNKPLDNVTNEYLDDGWTQIDNVMITCSSGRIYVYHPYNLTVLDDNGSFLFRLDNVSDPAAVDEYGDVYAVPAVKPSTYISDLVPNYKVTSSLIDAYYPNGTLWWQKNLTAPAQRQKLDTSLAPEYWTLPLYRNGTLYVPQQKSLVALDREGNELWSENFSWGMNLLWKMPFDAENNLYMTYDPEYSADHFFSGYDYPLYVIAPDGKSSNYTMNREDGSMASGRNGTGYFVYPDNWDENPGSLNDLITMNITANDLRTGQDLWTFVLPTNHINDITLDSANIGYLDYYYLGMANLSVEYNQKHPELQNLSRSEIGPWNVDRGAETMLILPTENVIYVSYYAFNYEYPRSLTSPPYDDGSDAYKYARAAVFNRSKIAVISDIYAIDAQGHLLWDRPTDSMVTSMAANNSTIYYGTDSGRIFGTQANIALGFALIAVAYLFLRFFCVGAVARARSRIDKNENRNSVMRYVVANPGSTLREISRGMRMNLGTVRYHIFILGLNHRIVTYQADGKHVRYFINSGTYSKEEQMIMSVMRRDSMRKILGTILIKPGISNVELSSEVGLPESAVSRYMKELAEKGIVVKELAPMGTSAYFLVNERRARVAKAMEIMKGA